MLGACTATKLSRTTSSPLVDPGFWSLCLASEYLLSVGRQIQRFSPFGGIQQGISTQKQIHFILFLTVGGAWANESLPQCSSRGLPEVFNRKRACQSIHEDGQNNKSISKYQAFQANRTGQSEVRQVPRQNQEKEENKRRYTQAMPDKKRWVVSCPRRGH